MFPNVILLAAGASTRMRTLKGLLDFQGRTWLEAQIDGLYNAKIAHLIIVLGHQYERYFETIPMLGEGPVREPTLQDVFPQMRVAINPNPERGMFSSLQTGLAALLDVGGSCFILPIDVPCPAQETWQLLASGLQGDALAAVPFYNGISGHPVLLSSALIERLLRLDPGDPKARLDKQLAALPPRALARIPVDDPKIAMNLNAPQDWQRFLQS